jgi:hypothetical protein
MNTIVYRLKQESKSSRCPSPSARLLLESALEIERLQAQVATANAERETMAAHCRAIEDVLKVGCVEDAATEIQRLRMAASTPNELLADVEQALDGWILTCSGEWCSRREVLAAQKRIAAGGGTLAYITSLRERVHEAMQV